MSVISRKREEKSLPAQGGIRKLCLGKQEIPHLAIKSNNYPASHSVLLANHSCFLKIPILCSYSLHVLVIKVK